MTLQWVTKFRKRDAEEAEPSADSWSSADNGPRAGWEEKEWCWTGAGGRGLSLCSQWNQGQSNRVLVQAEETDYDSHDSQGQEGQQSQEVQESWPPKTKTGKGCSANSSGSLAFLKDSQTGLPSASWTWHWGGSRGEPWSQWNIITSFLARDTGYHLKKRA